MVTIAAYLRAVAREGPEPLPVTKYRCISYQFTVMGWIVDNILPENFLKYYQIGEVFLLIGFFYTIKRVFKTLWNLHEAFKTFILPLFWPRNFPEEYGSWAGQSGFIFNVLGSSSILDMSNFEF